MKTLNYIGKDSLKKIIGLLNVSQKKKIFFLVVLVLLSSGLELLGLGLIIPAIGILVEPNYLNQVANNYNLATGIPIVIEDDGDGENQDGGEGNNADNDDDDETSEVGPCDDGNRSLLTPKSNINLSSNSINFNSNF